jgi:hypothetical protein
LRATSSSSFWRPGPRAHASYCCRRAPAPTRAPPAPPAQPAPGGVGRLAPLPRESPRTSLPPHRPSPRPGLQSPRPSWRRRCPGCLAGRVPLLPLMLPMQLCTSPAHPPLLQLSPTPGVGEGGLGPCALTPRESPQDVAALRPPTSWSDPRAEGSSRGSRCQRVGSRWQGRTRWNLRSPITCQVAGSGPGRPWALRCSGEPRSGVHHPAQSLGVAACRGGRVRASRQAPVDRWMDGRVDGRMGGRWMDGWMDGWMGGWTDGWMGGRVDGWTDEWTDGRMDA